MTFLLTKNRTPVPSPALSSASSVDVDLWQLVVSGMALASGQTMKAFDERAAAERWLTAD